MAQDLEISVKLKTELERASKDISSLKNAGAFGGPQGAKALNRVQGLFAQLQNADLSKLKGTQITEFANNLNKLRHYLDVAGRSLTNYSQEYANQLKKVEQATLAVSKAQDKQTAALDKQKAALSQLDLTSKGYKYQNRDSGRRVTNPDTIADLFNKGRLQIFNNKGVEVTGGAYNTTTEKMGLKAYAEATKEVAQANLEVKNATITVTNEQNTLARTPMGATIHPVTAEVGANSQLTSQTITDIKEQINSSKAEDIKETANAIDAQNSALKQQSSTLGKAFKQFTIYAIALRTVKKALNEAVKTVKELDRALTEQAMVTGLTRKQTYGLLNTYQDMAARLGSTTKEVSSTMTQFLRQGRSIEESLKLTEAAVSAAKVAGISAADSINYLTTAINGFRLSADDAMKVSDKFAAVAASAATSYEEIAIALSKVAAQANLAGMSIDYTTALLTKGIETTREAPETIGTALKTVIARMRELSDYGETLGGDTNINNVESQLAYIGIALRDNNGELRSTEDVLNELGGKWDDLNANQQAAIAKALAGTRQQSRLIAMMSDYERVIELQEIAERSQGATMAQMATYMEGMDAALNKVSVAWEKIVSTITESEVIINIINLTSEVMNVINDVLSNTAGMIATLTVIGAIGLSILGNKMKERLIAREQLSLARKQEQAQRQQQILNQKNYILSLKALVNEKQKTIEQLQQNKAQAEANGDLAAAAKYDQQIKDTEAEINQIQTEQIPLEERKLDALKDEDKYLTGQENAVTSLTEGWANLLTPIMMVITAVKLLTKLNDVLAAKRKKQNAEELTEEGEKAAAKGTTAAGEIISQLGVVGIPIALAVAAALGAAIIGIAVAVKRNANTAENAANQINQLSKEIYDLNKKSTGLNTVISKFDDLDNKILKTNDDLKEMSNLLASAADSLSDEEKEVYNSLTTDQARREYLASLKATTDTDLASKRAEQRQKILSLRSRGGAQWNDWLSSNDSSIIQSRDAMYALNNAYLYNSVDALKIDKERAKAIETITQNILAQVNAAKAAAILADQNQIDRYVNALASKGNATSILSSDDYTITERVAAFKELHNAIADLGDEEIRTAFETVNKEWATFAKMSANTLEYIDRIGADIAGINDLAEAIQKLGHSSDESTAILEQMFTLLDQGADLGATIADMFGMDAYDSILNAYDKAFGTTILNMGQNIDKFKNTVDAFYEKAKDWATMSDTDKTSFISEHADLFKGEQGGRLLEAFESGNYSRIAEALRENDALTKQREQLIKDIDKQLEIEYARQELDHAYIRELEQNKRELEDLNKIYLASLKMRYDQQQAQLDMYKDLLQKETDALTEALEKRKEAYQKYFDAINKEAEEEEYEEKAQLLISNIAKLGSSTNADAMAKTADLAKQLENLEKERLKELRQQAQEAVIQNIEDEVTKISDNLEKLLNNEQALLSAMTKDANTPSELIASLMSAQYATGNNTELGMQSYLQQMQSTFASIMPGVDWGNVDVEQRGDSLVLNIMGKEIQLSDGEQQTIYDAIQQALKQLGYN